MNSNIQIAEKLTGVSLIDKRSALDSVLINNNTLAAFDYQIEGLQHRQKLASKEGLPQFNVGFDYTFGRSAEFLGCLLSPSYFLT